MVSLAYEKALRAMIRAGQSGIGFAVQPVWPSGKGCQIFIIRREGIEITWQKLTQVKAINNLH